ncbi:hypothetical protein FACS1894198_6140 [Clostridia bacterium]|nr:hypothetical protein FACS1894198_6140 [Clostridia bacterium]
MSDFEALQKLTNLLKDGATAIRMVEEYLQTYCALYQGQDFDQWVASKPSVAIMELGLGTREREATRLINAAVAEAVAKIRAWNGAITEPQARNQFLKEVADALFVFLGRATTSQKSDFVKAIGDYLWELITGYHSDVTQSAPAIGKHWDQLTHIDPATCVPDNMRPIVKSDAGKQVLAVLRDFV